MDMAWIPLVGASCTLALGILGVSVPGKVAGLVGILPRGELGLSEIRATYGGLFIGLGAACLWFQQPEVYLTAGLAWCLAAVARLASVFAGRCFDGKNIGGVIVEAGIGLSLVAGSL